MTQILTIALHAFEAVADFFRNPDLIHNAIEDQKYRSELLKLMSR